MCLKEELNAIREFIVNDKSYQNSICDLTKNYTTPIPSFIRACHVQFDSDEKQLQNDKTKNYAISLSQSQKLGIVNKSKIISNFVTPDLETSKKNKTADFFYPISSETKDSCVYLQSYENLNKLISCNTRADSSRNASSDAAISSNKKRMVNVMSKSSRNMYKKQGVYNMSSSSSMKKQV